MRSLVCIFIFAVRVGAADFTVHEWGTFTSVSGSDGRRLSGLEAEEESLPAFVGSFAGFAPANKGWDRPVSGVTIKMETPVLYFYSAEPLAVRIAVAFDGGSISQWYPQRSGGEQLPPAPSIEKTRMLPPIDFAAGHQGSVNWQLDVLAPDSPLAISAPRAWETPQWPRARIAGANRVRGPKGEVEGFVFYRGLGNFELPLRVTCDASGRVHLRNTGTSRISFAFVYDRQSAANRSDAIVWWHGPLEAGEEHESMSVQSAKGESSTRIREDAFPTALMAAGLTHDEAVALLATWRESYFERPGLRVFWIVPRAFTDAVLPIAITPSPAKMERVLVGRTEVLTPAFEAQLVRDFAADGGRRWESDRYFRAYRERVGALRTKTAQASR